MTFAGMTVPYSVILLHVLVLLCASPPCHGETHNITALLAASPDFTDFSAALVAANLTGKIDGHGTITVLPVDNAAMARLRARALTPDGVTRVLSLHVLLDYFDDAKLKALNGTTQAASLFQDSGAAPGGAGMVIVTATARAGDGRPGVAFAAEDAGGHSVFYEKSVKESPYDIAVLQVTDAMESPSAEGKALAPVVPPVPAPAGAPSPKNETAPPPQPAVGPSSPKNQTAPAPPPKPAVAPSSPTNQTAQPPKPASAPPAPAPGTPADAPDADNQPPADDDGQHNDGADGTVAPWSVLAAVAAVVLLLW
ncbi:unnamed protein product [Alopecurus aequalis]